MRTMTVICLLLAATTVSACGESSPTAPLAGSKTESQLDGLYVYRPHSTNNSFEYLRFSGDSFEARRARCTGAACTRIGKYRVDAAKSLLTLADDESGTESVFVLSEVVRRSSEATTPSGSHDEPTQPRSIRPRDIELVVGEALLLSSFSMNCQSGCDGAKGGAEQMRNVNAKDACPICRGILLCGPTWCTINGCCG